MPSIAGIRHHPPPHCEPRRFSRRRDTACPVAADHSAVDDSIRTERGKHLAGEIAADWIWVNVTRALTSCMFLSPPGSPDY